MPSNVAGIIKQYQDYLQVERGTSPLTFRLYRDIVERFFQFCETNQHLMFLPENWELQDLGTRELEFFLREHQKSQGWKANTQVTYITAIRSFFEYLYRKGLIPRNPTLSFRVKPEASKVSDFHVEQAHVEQVFEQLSGSSLNAAKDQLLFELAYSLGVPPSKISSIQNIEFSEEQDLLLIQYPDKQQEFPAGAQTSETLSQYLEARKQCLQPIPREVTIFWVDEAGNTLSDYKIKQSLKRILSMLGDFGGQLKVFRELSSLHFARQGADVRSIRKLRGVKGLSRVQNFKEQDFQSLMQKFQKSHIRN